MRFRSLNAALSKAGLAASALLFTTGVAMADTAVTLTASPTTTTLPDGQSVPMWGLMCGTVSGSSLTYNAGTDSTGLVAEPCTTMSGGHHDGRWQPPLITVPVGQSLAITLVDNLSFATTTATGGAGARTNVPTSLVIVGQLGGGLGTERATMPSPVHAPQGTTWPGTLGDTDAVGITAIHVINAGAGYSAPPNITVSGRGASAATAVASVSAGAVTAITVTNGAGYTSATVSIDPPPCVIDGSTCVQAAATAVVDASASGAADAPPTFRPPAQADRVRSFGAEVTVGNAKVLTWDNLRAGTYLIESGTEPSIQGPMGLYGVLVVTEPNDSTGAHTAYGSLFDADVALLLSEIDPVQNDSVDLAVTTDGFNDALVWSAQPGQCGDPAVHTCYPPAVNYSPLYYLVNGVAFDRTNSGSSARSVAAAGAQKNVLLRMVNAGLRMHVPSVVGSSMTLLAEDGNKLPGNARKQSEVLLTAGKTYDVTIQPAQTVEGTYDPATYAVFDRALSLSTSNQRDGGMQAYLNVAGGAPAGTPGSTQSATTLSASDRTFYCVAGERLSVSDPSKGLLAGATGANGVALGNSPVFGGAVTASNLVLRSNGTFSYAASTPCAGSFTYVVNGSQTHTATIADCSADSSCSGDAPVAGNNTYTSNIATRLQVPPPGVLAFVTNPSTLPLTALPSSATSNCATVKVNADGSFTATPTAGSSSCSFNYNVQTSTKRKSESDGTITINFLPASNLNVVVRDAKTPKPATGTDPGLIRDYRWIIEEDKTFWVDPKCQINNPTGPRLDSRGQACPQLPVESLGYSFHTSNMPVVAEGCVGNISCEDGQTVQGSPATCDIGNGACRAQADASGLGVTVDATAGHKIPVSPAEVHLDPNKRYFISILPGDGVNATIGGAGGPDTIQVKGQDKDVPFDIARDCGAYNPSDPRWQPGNLGDANGVTALCGHAMGGAQIPPAPISAGVPQARPPVTIVLQETPLPTAKLAVFVFQDDAPLNGENDAGGGVDVLAPNEPGLGGFNIEIFDQAGGLGDATGQITYDEFNQPVSNSLANTIDPMTGLDACPINARGDGLVGMIPTCPKYESDGKTLSPLAGQAVIANLYAGLYEVTATPAAERIQSGEEWLQTNTLDGGKPHEAFLKPNEPGYFQEFGPGGFHVSIGFANKKIIDARKTASFCASLGGCNSNLTVNISNNHMSRTPDQRTFSSGTYDHYSFTNCYVSLGTADAEDFALEKCDPDGHVTFKNVPAGTFKIAVFDQWNDIMLDGLVGSVVVSGNTVKDFPVSQWRANLFTRTFIDDGNGSAELAGNGIPDRDADGNDLEAGLALVNTNIRYRDGSIGFFNNTDLAGYAGFNEVFPLMSWLVVETTDTRYKPTGVHIVYDAGGAVDGSGSTDALDSSIAANIANTKERTQLPSYLKVPGARYCGTADCLSNDNAGGSTGAVVPPQPWGTTQGWQGLLGQNSFIDFGVKPFATNENGGIKGHVIYASTRPFDDPALSLQLSWEPGVPHVKVNLYRKTVDEFGNAKLTLVDTTATTSWDDWAQGFRRDAAGNLMTVGTGANARYIPNMNCPGQDATSPFFATLKGSKQWLDPDKLPLANDSQFKCYDGWSVLNQVQPAPYDGMYKFPSVTAVDPTTGKPAKTNCTACDQLDADGNPMLAPGTYVVEVVLPQGYELVKEEDKNILLGDVFIAPVTQQFAGFGNIFIMPDQAAVNAHYNPNNPGSLNLTSNLGASPRHEGDTGSVETFWPCVGAERIVPDLNSLFPGAGQAAPFAGAKRRLCDRKEVILNDQASVLAKFYVFSSTHIAGHFTGMITNDFASEFDPFSPQFGEKFGPPNLPVGLRDFTGNEVSRVYSDQWGLYNGLFFSSYSVNPPNPTGYVPQMSIACMNDPGPIDDPAHPGQKITDPAYSPAYSNFCYEWPFMPGSTAYMDTPVIPTMSFADGYNLPDSEYPNATPAIKSVVNSSSGSTAPPGPWVTAGSPATRASVQFSIADVAVGDSISSITAGGTTTITNGAITCNTASLCLGGGGVLAQAARNARMATLIANSVNARTSATGYTASASVLVFPPTVTVNAPANSGAASNGVALAVNTTNITVAPSALALAGGADATPAALRITITALGDKEVQNPNFSGPNSTAAPFNQKTITRHYGFGDQPAACPTSGPCGASTGGPGVTIGGVRMNNVTWNDTTIVGDVNPTGVASCMAQRGQTASQCGELVITAANGKQSIDTVTVTIGGSLPWIVTPSGVTPPAGSNKQILDYSAAFGRLGASPLQTAIDSASPGDLILVTPGTYRENLIMWKPVRLQGVGAAAVTINADAHPAGKMDSWRRQVNCTFGLSLDGTPNPGDANFDGTDPNNGGYTCPPEMHQRVDRIPFEAIVGWDAAGNGNLAQVLQEPTLMGAYEGAGITVLGRGVRIPNGSTDFWGLNATGGPGAFTDGSVYLTTGNNDCTARPTAVDGTDYGTSNFLCNPSRIDGVSVVNSSQGGGGIFIHGWNHRLEVGNTRISGNHGTLAGGINLGNGETPDAYINDQVECGVTPAVMPCPPIGGASLVGAPYATPAVNAAIAFQWNTNVHIHHNMIYNNASIGDALFSGTPAGAGAITVSAGADKYLIDHNWMAGNLSTGDGGGLQHLGLSFGGQIKNNYILFNQSTNPTLPTNGGGVIIEGANLDRLVNGQECGSTTDQDCPPGLGEGAGMGTVVDANLILGNSAESGSGGGLRLQQINGSEVAAFLNGNPGSAQWYDVTVTNNIIANNVAGWDGGGVSMQDALKVTFVNNTVASNDTTASAGSLFKTLGAVSAASPPPGCQNSNNQIDLNCNLDGSALHGPQPAGLVVMANTPNLTDVMPSASNAVACPSGYGYTANTLPSANRNDCRKVSKPKLVDDLFWQNRAFSVNIIGSGSGNQSQQNLIALTPVLNQSATGACASGAVYRDIGIRTDDFGPGRLLTATNGLTVNNSIYTSDWQSIITTGTGTGLGPNRTALDVSAPPMVAQYCNGARVPPENCAAQGGQTTQSSCRGYNTPVGASETTSTSQLFQFNGIQPTATVDEGHNWLNLVYGPLTLSRPNVASATNPESMLASRAIGTIQGAYSIPGTSGARNLGTSSTGTGSANSIPATTAVDFFGNPRPSAGGTGTRDAGAVQFTSGSAASVNPTVLGFGDTKLNTPSDTQTLTVTSGSTALTNVAVVFSGPFARSTSSAGNCPTPLSLAASTATVTNSCTIGVTFTPVATGAATGSVTIAAISGSPVALTGNGVNAASLALTASSTLLQFGDAFVGTTTSTAQTVTLTAASAVTNVSIGGLSASGPFVAAAGSTCPTAAFDMTAGTSCTINVVFHPITLNPVTGAVTVTAGNPAGSVAVDGAPLQMTGNGLLPAVTPNPVNFGDVPVGTQARQTLTLSNANNINSNSLAFTFTAPSIVGTGFSRPTGSAGGTCGTTLAAGATCTIVVQFSQAAGTSATGATSGTLTIQGNGGATTVPVVNLNANSIAATYIATITPTSLAFGDQTVGTSSATQNLTLTNTGNSALGAIAVTGPFGRVTTGTFPAGAGNCGTTLAVGASCTVKVRFTPTAAGSANGSVTIAGANAATPATGGTAALTGNGVAARALFGPASFSYTPPGTLGGGTLAFGNQSGQVYSIVTITAVGSTPLTFGTASVTTSSNNTGFSKGADSCSGSTLAPNGTCTIRINFNAPTGTTNRTGTLSLIDSGGAPVAVPLNLTGS